MRRCSKSTLYSYLLAACAIACLPAEPLLAETLRRVPIHRSTIVSDAVGPANIVLSNVYGTSVPEIVSCSGGSAFALTRSGDGYRPVWNTQDVDCTAVAAGDINGDGALEVVVGTTTPPSLPGTLQIFTPHLYGAARASVQLPGTQGVNDVAIGNVDGDPEPEIVAVTGSAAYVFDAATLALDWTASGRGGHTVAIADVEGDGPAEIVISGSDGHVLDGASGTFKWGYAGGFGTYMAVGDIDADGKPEIVGVASRTVRIVHGDTLASTTFTLYDYHVAQSIAIGDGNDDGQLDIVVGEDQWGEVRGYAANGSPIWYVSNPEHGVSGIAVGDVDGDGQNETVWGAGWSSTGTDSLFVGNAATHAVEWSAPDLDGPLHATAADLDGDGSPELIVAFASTDSGYDPGLITISDSRGNLLRQWTVPSSYYDLNRLAVGQLDGDPALEIVVLVDDYYAKLYSFDGVTGDLEWTGPSTFSSYGPLLVANVDADPLDEIIVATTDGRIQILNGASPIVQSATAVLDGSVQDVAVADLDGDSVLDLVAGTTAGYYVFKASDLSERHHTTVSGSKQVAATSGEFAVTISTYSSTSVVGFAGDTFLERWQCNGLPSTFDVGYITMESSSWLAVAENTLKLYPSGGTGCPDAVAAEHAIPGIRSFSVADATGDGNPELILSAATTAEVALFSWASSPRGDADGDGLVTDADMDTLVDFLYGEGGGIAAGADVNGDFALRPDDLIYLMNYRRGTGAAPPQ